MATEVERLVYKVRTGPTGERHCPRAPLGARRSGVGASCAQTVAAATELVERMRTPLLWAAAAGAGCAPCARSRRLQPRLDRRAAPLPAPLAQAKLAEEAERFEDMVGFVTALAKQKTLSVEERNLLSVAFKNVVGSKRASWRILSGIEAKEREIGDPARADRVGGLRGVVEEELAGVCTALLDLIDGTLLPKDATPEGIAFYNKMAGDYNRYMAEFATGPQRESAAGSAAARYDAARRAAEGLPATDPIRLGLALNHSVFLLEIMGRHTEACEVAKAAFDAGVTHVSSLSGADYRDATLILQLMRDNLALWTEEGAEAGAGAGVGAA